MSVLILAVGAFALYKQSSHQKEEAQKEKKLLFLPEAELEGLKAVRIYKTKEEALSIIKKEQDWFLVEPVEDFASLTVLSRWFNEISRQKVKKLELDDNPDWKAYYLDQYPFVELDFKSGESLSFSVSSKSSFDGRWFVKKAGQIFLAESSFANEVNNKNLDDFRSKKILASLNHASRIQFKSEQSFTLNWKDHHWSLEGATETTLPLDQERLNAFWTDLTGMEADSILESVKFIKKYKLDRPALTLNLFYGDKEYILKLSSVQKDKLYAVISHRDYIFEISKDKLDKIQLSKEKIYNHKFPFDYDIALAEQIEIKNETGHIKIKKKKDKWELLLNEKTSQKEESKDKDLIEPDKPSSSQEKEPLSGEGLKASDKKLSSEEEILDPEKVRDFLDQLKSLKGRSYQQIKEPKALRFILIQDSKSQTLFELKEFSQSKEFSWLKSNLWREGVAVSKEELDKIFDFSFFKTKPEQKN